MKHLNVALVTLAVTLLVQEGVDANPQPFMHSIISGINRLLYGSPKVQRDSTPTIEEKVVEKSFEAMDDFENFSVAENKLAPEGRFLFSNPLRGELLLTKGIGHSIIYSKIESLLDRLTNIDQDLDELDDINDTLNSIRDAITTLTSVLNGLVVAVASLDSSFTIVIAQLNTVINDM